jgi:site-specific DNA-methyltransferase (adenine-specific)
VILQKRPIRAKGVWTAHNIPDVWYEATVTSAHPHSKPEKLQEALICAVTKENDLVLDPAMGGGSVLTACEKSGRNFIGCDILV